MEVVAEGDPTWNVVDGAEECGLSDDMEGVSISPAAVPCVPYESHAPPFSRRRHSKYWLFYSAKYGCPVCVKYYIEVKKVDPASTSDTCNYSVRDFADHARKMNVAGAQAVLDYLNSAVPQGCSPGKSHMPPASRAHQRKYFLFHAANAGCKTCVAYYLEEEKVDPQSVSDTNGYTVMDWADWALKRDVPGALDVVNYLREQWPGVRAKDERAEMALLDTQHAA